MKRAIPYILFALFIFLLPVLMPGSYWIHVLVIIGTYVIAATGIDLLVGFAGQLSLCQASFFTLGAYSSAVLVTRYHFDHLAAMVAGVVSTAIVAYVVGAPVLRLKGYYLAIATLGVGLIIQSLLVSLAEYTGGPDGFRDIAPLKVAGFIFKSDVEYYYLIWIIAMLVLLVTRNIVNSRVGRAMLAIRGDDVAAASMGIDIAKYKIQAFIISAVYASLAGSLYAHSNSFISPQLADLSNSVEMIIIVVLGGIRTIFGVLIGTAIMKSIPELLESFLDYQMAITGIILILLLLYMPKGLLGIIRQINARRAP
ncbi:MAG: branched-chain amino acid ABC transporter permease [Desulfuromonadaceae bacterium]|nr:branched-chain amino acid ABC transporter permease [Desulfuromonadaceae bacterium]